MGHQPKLSTAKLLFSLPVITGDAGVKKAVNSVA